MKNEQLPPLSVVIAARNEADNIYENIPFIMSQDYPEFEVIVVINQTVDESKYILMAYQQSYKNLRFSVLEKNKHIKPGKKLPLHIGIKAAKYEHVVITDADCKPASNNWLQEIGSSFSEDKHLVLGYGPYEKEVGFLNKVIRFDTAWIAINYFSFALSKLPYMGVGRNLAYTKKLFNQVQGFKSHYAISSGDDDLFIQEAANRNYVIQIKPPSYMYSKGKTTWTDWFQQKSRHYTTAPNYQVIKKTLLGIYPLSLILMYVSCFILLLDEQFRLLTLIILGVILSIKWIVQGLCFRKINEKSFIAWLPLTEILYTIGLPILYYTSDNKNSKW